MTTIDNIFEGLSPANIEFTSIDAKFFAEFRKLFTNPEKLHFDLYKIINEGLVFGQEIGFSSYEQPLPCHIGDVATSTNSIYVMTHPFVFEDHSPTTLPVLHYLSSQGFLTDKENYTFENDLLIAQNPMQFYYEQITLLDQAFNPGKPVSPSKQDPFVTICYLHIERSNGDKETEYFFKIGNSYDNRAIFKDSEKLLEIANPNDLHFSAPSFSETTLKIAKYIANCIETLS